jgi:hypothetical protein
MVVVSIFKTSQPNSWPAGLGRNGRSVGEGGGGTLQFKQNVSIERVILVVVSMFEALRPNSWLAGLGRNRRSVGEGAG